MSRPPAPGNPPPRPGYLVFPDGGEVVTFSFPSWAYMLYPLPGEFCRFPSQVNPGRQQLWLCNQPDFNGRQVRKFELLPGLELWCSEVSSTAGAPQLLEYDLGSRKADSFLFVLAEMFASGEFAQQLIDFMSMGEPSSNVLRYSLQRHFMPAGYGDALLRFTQECYGRNAWHGHDTVAARTWMSDSELQYLALLSNECWQVNSRRQVGVLRRTYSERHNYLMAVREAASSSALL